MNEIRKTRTSDLTNKVKELIDRYATTPTLSGLAIFTPKRTPPQFLYKYTSIDSAIKIIGDCCFRYSQREVLDDVFEESPCRDEISSMLPGFEDGPTILINTHHSEEDLIRLDKIKSMRLEMRRVGETIQDDIAIINPNNTSNIFNKKFLHTIDNISRPLALSLTENLNSKTMWASYGDNHRGICMVINTRSMYFISNRDRISTAGYFAPIIYRPLTAEDYAFRFPSERFFIKTDEWKTQNEWRRVEYVIDNKDMNWKNDIHTFPFPSSILKGIIFGIRCDKFDMEKIITLVKSKPSLKHVSFYKTKRTINHLAIEEI
ncbi:hypothetical protein BN1007_71132 [Klebsiella variicola]|uniref:DUF2971 domain-containing protein n=1 Tax=Klebsiella variicola TaxID=244366 RepID=UPI0006722C75|nr:DUF2971 domain-containing protein [Klebsiella variicola]CTQ18709.1 hypothetical protein BN1007_71132 [Klebsiella variicola]CTQ25754.1 hypothetical protein BN1200_870013 [Klebsiella variicola]